MLDGDRNRNVLTLSSTNGSSVTLTAEGTSDPDGNSVRMTWWIYPEAGNVRGATLTASEGLKTEVRLPPTKSPANCTSFFKPKTMATHIALPAVAPC